MLRLVTAHAGQGAVRSVGWVSQLDERRQGLLSGLGSAPDGSPMTVFQRATGCDAVPDDARLAEPWLRGG